MMWIGGLFILLSLAWVIARTSGYGLETPISYRPPPSPSGRPAKVTSQNPPGGGARLFGTNVEAIPSLVTEEDDLELTIITASPSTDMPSAAVKPPTSADAIRAETPSVKVIYEDEAEIEEVTSPHARILISASSGSDTGRHRPRNEDSMLVLPERSIFAVADGMGGYE